MMRKPDCCEFMRQQLNYYCDQCGDNYDKQVLKWVKMNKGTDNGPDKYEVLIVARNGWYECKFCPSCGERIYENAYDPDFGDDRECECGHTYERHFDTYEDMRPVGCKYCGWEYPEFREKKK